MNNLAIKIYSIHFHPFVIVREKNNEFFLTVKKTGDTYVLPKKLALILSCLSNEPKISQAKKMMISQHQFWKNLDLDLFLAIEEAKKIGIVCQINEQKINFEEKIQPLKLNKFFKPLANIFFSQPFYIFSVAIVLIGWLFLIYQPGIFPHSHSFFWSNYTSLNLLSLLILSLILTIGHEGMHYLAALSRGIAAKFGINTRLTYVVAETIYNDIFSIPEKYRYRIYLSGMGFDLLTLSLAFIFLGLFKIEIISLNYFWQGILQQLVLIQFFSLAWQFLIFLRTDVYYFLIDLFDIEELPEIFSHNLNKLWHSLEKFKKPKHILTFYDTLPAKKKIIVYLFFFIALIGSGIVIFNFIFYAIPIFKQNIFLSLNNLYSSVLHQEFWQILDAFFTIIFQSLTLIVLLILFSKKIINYLSKKYER